MVLTILLCISVFLLAYSNGANDNFKGVATLFGSGSTSYKKALSWANLCTLLGSLASIFLAQGLIQAFSGKGLVSPTLSASLPFLFSVALGAGFTVLLATFLGFPISTTHSLLGGLLGAALACIGAGGLNLSALGSQFVLPLLFSPLVALVLSYGSYLLFSLFGYGLKAENDCLCIGEAAPALSSDGAAFSFQSGETLGITAASTEDCDALYGDNALKITSDKILRGSHILSAGFVSFARGLNDTPKIAALFLVLPAFNVSLAAALVAVGIGVGALCQAKKVANTMSLEITPIPEREGFCGNMVTGVMVMSASLFSLPVSTTHVSVGAIFGIGCATGKIDSGKVREILLSWIVTLPLAGLLSALTYFAISHL